ncbi:hypothetical protein P171DRAFT_437669 [Karstenula rhodostoma CBS 690.94]|uniref:Uncharacterized protein n=1 Tax=Karstenula rhodostoma CBS 690.94 TaxID=1392251 RepID=A0A9P4P6T5_9PLEO|nr:hypothetical protein P171DRAFT_437669 [Karstenula rhodostoma CBS 690.94]
MLMTEFPSGADRPDLSRVQTCSVTKDDDADDSSLATDTAADDSSLPPQGPIPFRGFKSEPIFDDIDTSLTDELSDMALSSSTTDSFTTDSPTARRHQSNPAIPAGSSRSSSPDDDLNPDKSQQYVLKKKSGYEVQTSTHNVAHCATVMTHAFSRRVHKIIRLGNEQKKYVFGRRLSEFFPGDAEGNPNPKDYLYAAIPDGSFSVLLDDGTTDAFAHIEIKANRRNSTAQGDAIRREETAELASVQYTNRNLNCPDTQNPIDPNEVHHSLFINLDHDGYWFVVATYTGKWLEYLSDMKATTEVPDMTEDDFAVFQEIGSFSLKRIAKITEFDIIFSAIIDAQLERTEAGRQLLRDLEADDRRRRQLSADELAKLKEVEADIVDTLSKTQAGIASLRDLLRHSQRTPDKGNGVVDTAAGETSTNTEVGRKDSDDKGLVESKLLQNPFAGEPSERHSDGNNTLQPPVRDNRLTRSVRKVKNFFGLFRNGGEKAAESAESPRVRASRSRSSRPAMANAADQQKVFGAPKDGE